MLAIGLLASALLVACGAEGSGVSTRSPAAAAQPPGPRQVSEGGGVTVQITWDDPGGALVFQVVMDTHSVDLDGYDLRELAVLNAPGVGGLRPQEWDAAKGGHHRSGRLVFPALTQNGKPVLGPADRALTLVVRDVGGVPERRFQWVW